MVKENEKIWRGMYMSFITFIQSRNLNALKVLIRTICIVVVTFPCYSIAESSTYEETISAGNRTYDRFCLVCHGKEAKGNGLYKENLRIAPADLTKLAKNNNGMFPWIMMYQIIDGKDISLAHGTSEMPIWGELFDISNWSDGNWKKGYTEHSIAITRGRIFELLVYLDFIQEE
jgi:mono/diheme cytochrome c family protein